MLSKSIRMALLAVLLMAFSTTASAPSAAQASSDDPPLSAGQAPYAVGSTGESTDPLLSPLAGGAAFMLAYPAKYLYYIPDIQNFEDWALVGRFADAVVANTTYYAGDFVGSDFSRIYVIDYKRNELHTLSTLTGGDYLLVDTPIGACNPIAEQGWTGATGTANGVLYASSMNGVKSYLYTVDIATGAATLVGEITNAPAIIDIAINTAGEMYGVDISGDNLVKIDPTTGAGTIIGSIGFDANFAQGMDFDAGILYLAAYNKTLDRGELRIANTVTGNSTLVKVFPNGDEVDVLAFTPPPTQILQNTGFESGWDYWNTQGAPILTNQDYRSGARSILLGGEDEWVWQAVSIPANAIDVTISYWLTGLSADPIYENDILCGGIWDLGRQTRYADSCFGISDYFYHYPKDEWHNSNYRLNADELANLAGKQVLLGFKLNQDWVPGYSLTSFAWVDDAALYVTNGPMLATATTLTSGLNPSYQGQPVTFNATVTANGAPTGAVTFYADGASLGTSTLNGSGVANYATSALSVGAHVITATYTGNAKFDVSTSNTVSQTVIEWPFALYLPLITK